MSYSRYITPEEYEIAERNGISKNLLEQRIRRLHWSHERAINAKPRKRGDYRYWSKVAEENGISYNTFSSRINRGWTPERAATEGTLSRSECGIRAGRTTPRFSREILDVLELSGITYQTFYARVKSGWDEMEAATSPLLSKKEAGQRSAAKMKERAAEG